MQHIFLVSSGNKPPVKEDEHMVFLAQKLRNDILQKGERTVSQFTRISVLADSLVLNKKSYPNILPV